MLPISPPSRAWPNDLGLLARSNKPEERCSAARLIGILTVGNADNQACAAEAGAIGALTAMLQGPVLLFLSTLPIDLF